MVTSYIMYLVGDDFWNKEKIFILFSKLQFTQVNSSIGKISWKWFSFFIIKELFGIWSVYKDYLSSSIFYFMRRDDLFWVLIILCCTMLAIFFQPDECVNPDYDDYSFISRIILCLMGLMWPQIMVVKMDLMVVKM